VANVKTFRFPVRINVIVFRNPYRRLVSGFLNKYVEHSKYLEASRRRRPDLDVDTFETFVDELHRHGLRAIDKLHFKPQIARYRHLRFHRLFNSEDLGPLTEFVNALFGTRVAMPFRVGKAGPKERRTEPEVAAAPISEAPAEWWRVGSRELLGSIQAKQLPPYEAFYNDALRQEARRIYADDFRFLQRCRERGLIDEGFHAALTSI
jgi:hypothetical protein